MNIFLIRHAETELNQQNIVQGYNTDAPLTKDGIEQAKNLGVYLKQFSFDQVFTSKLARTIKTAEICMGISTPIANQMEYLNERSYGKFEGGTKETTLELYSTKSAEFKKLTHEQQLHYTFHNEIESDCCFHPWRSNKKYIAFSSTCKG